MSVSQQAFGTTAKGESVHIYTITNALGNSVSILDFGAIIQAICIQDKSGTSIDCCLGFNTVEEYEATGYIGACIGRVANRIGGGRFELNGQTYNLAFNKPNLHLHGGIEGFNKKVFDVRIDNEQSITCSYVSPHMEEGYPAELHLDVTYTFDDDNQLILDYHATNNDEKLDTIINLTNHGYFNLDGEGSGTILDHEFQLSASYITEVNDGLIPNGRLLDVTDTPFDFRQPKTLGQDIHSDHPQIVYGFGYDQNFCIDGEGLRQCSMLKSKKTGLTLYTSTDLPGVQIYTGNKLPDVSGKSGGRYGYFSGVSIETQDYPDAIAHPNFPSIVLGPKKVYHHTTIFRFVAE